MKQSITTAVPATTTSTGVLAGTLDISGVTGDFTIELTYENLTAAAGVPATCLVFEDSTDGFVSDIQPVALDAVRGPVFQTATVEKTRRSYTAPTLRAGVTNAKLRARVNTLTGTSPSLTVLVELAF
jgi:hypothetical protein